MNRTSLIKWVAEINPWRKLGGYCRGLRMRRRESGWPLLSSDEEMPLRSELFSADQMAQHGKSLAKLHSLATGSAPDGLLARLAANESVLVGVCKMLTLAVTEKRRVTPAGEWLLDNFYLIEEQIRTAKRHLPKGYSRELPRLAQGPSAGHPRVYDLALETVAHGDGRVDTETLGRFVAAYQAVTALKLGELWAIPIMLRLAVIENLRRVGVRIAATWEERNLADSWADRMTETAENDPKSLVLVIADMARSNPPMVSAFVAELVRRLQGRGSALALPLSWLEQRLSELGLTIEQMVHAENQQQAANQVSISNSIGSLRVIGAMDWQVFVEAQSIVEQTLRADPGAIYCAMDFATRDRYRHAVEQIARQCRIAESEVARQAVVLARDAVGSHVAGSPPMRNAHVGYYLVDQGRCQLERAAGLTLSAAGRISRKAGEHPLLFYLGGIALITAFLSACLLLQAAGLEVSSGWSEQAAYWVLLPIFVIALPGTSQLAVAMVNWLATLLVSPHPLPRMDFSAGIPPGASALVVIPTMLTSTGNVQAVVEALEVRFLANRTDNLFFGLLTDFLDAPEVLRPDESVLLELAKASIEALNRKYGADSGRKPADIFFLFHRARQWSPQQSVWMGHERKRGKLADLNVLLRSGATDGFALIVGDTNRLSPVKYVITLDTDTQLPRGVACQFIGAMAHPLNRPQFDPVSRCITAGYGILQPRVAVSLPGTNRSRFARLFGGEPGVDPYTRAVSDVYQDVFGEGSFIGKGIYDVDAFEQALGARLPENLILSHDLIEGCYARSGLLSDVQLYEENPARYGAEVNRRVRWLRGDWQLAGWLRRRVPGLGSRRERNPLSWLSQWKLIDNLRRSLVPASLLLLLMVGWLWLPGAGWWTLSVLGILLAPALCASILDLSRKPDEVLPLQHLQDVIRSLARHLTQASFEIACLPHAAWFCAAAIARTLWRVLVTRRDLLEWNPSSEADRALAWGSGNELMASLRSMWMAPGIAILGAIAVAAMNPAAFASAVPILLLWLLAPFIAWWISRPLARREATLTGQQLVFLRGLARRTWAFFEHAVGDADHWLPPDNVQDYRVVATAHRTSPTNIGMALLANLAAHDFGYLSTGELLRRTAHTLDTMAGLPRYRGHFYNWYDTLTLEPLLPLYVSTVDSGNLAGHLLTLRAGLLELAEQPLLPVRLLAGLDDALGLLREANGSTNRVAAGSLAAFRRELDSAMAAEPSSVSGLRDSLGRLAVIAGELLVQIAGDLDHNDVAAQENEAKTWAQALSGQCLMALDDLELLVPAAAGQPSLPTAPEFQAMPSLRRLAQAGNVAAGVRMRAIEAMAGQAGDMSRMEYRFLYDEARHLMTIGYNVSERRLDSGHYDLLASEARLACFVAIAQGELPQESWFSLGRLLTSTAGSPVLLSWSGSMFEYLMPLLVMPGYKNTLLDQTCNAAVARQIEYGRQRGVPWGISESGYNTVDIHLNYQYHAFGVPGLGLKRGLADDLVVAPYASALALMVAPEAACANLQRLAGEGMVGKFGLFEAIDYTPARQRRGKSSAVVRSFMAHHQGMSLLALDYLLLDRPMQRRFESDRLFQACLLLLQERIPKATALFAHTAELVELRATSIVSEAPLRLFDSPDTPVPEVQLLSNGRYHVMLTNAGGGYSRWKDIAVTRWQEDATCDNWGSFCYVRDLASGSFWSAAHQPTLRRAERYEAIFTEGRAEFRRLDAVGGRDGIAAGRIETYTEVVVSPEDDIELRRVRITNRSRHARQVELTTYAEVVIAPAAADALHPAFSNLFVQTEILPERRAILCTRRPRSLGEKAPWMLHLMAAHGAAVDAVSFETDRSRFIGRTRSVVAPLALFAAGPLSGSGGSVLDPVVAIRCVISLEPEQSVSIDIVTGISETRDAALGLIDKYQDRHLAHRVFDLAWTHSQVALRQLNASEADSQLHACLARSVIYANPSLRADPKILIRNRRSQSGLWGYAISGDLPIVLLQIRDEANIELVQQLVKAHAYWRLKGVAVDLVIWNEDHNGYRQQLQERVLGLIASGVEAGVVDRPGGIFVRYAAQISTEDRILLQSVARVVISDTRGTLLEQLDCRDPAAVQPPRFKPGPLQRHDTPHKEGATEWPPRRSLILDNGLGGFTTDGREYVISLAPGQATPAPWANVLANPKFGCIVSESGGGYTWSENAHEFRLTPWHNDPVGDPGGEAIYLRDEESGHVWSPTPLPVRADSHYAIRHGFGYSVFETSWDGIRSELWVFVAVDASLKFSLLKLHNESGRARRISATVYVEWVLGDLRAKSAMHVGTEVDPASGALFARNRYNGEFAERVAFLHVDDSSRGVTGDRVEFLGRNGTWRDPAAMKRVRLSGRVGAGLDPCGAMQVAIYLADGQEHEQVFRLGVGRSSEDVADLLQRFRGVDAAHAALEAVWAHWNEVLGAVQVETPYPSIDVLTNGWLVYQTLACRVWARSGYYQSGGAYGFRDQLQDMMALVHARPDLVREHLLLCASRQFEAGDVQHWWHPPAGRGVRTHCSDDYLWLPLAVCRYVACTGDTGVLDEVSHFLDGRAVSEEDDSYYDLPGRSGETASLYQHCVRAIRHGLRFGRHGLPLIGSGDWNDGMNLVGMEGRGESVWLGFFLCHVLDRFSALAGQRGDGAFAELCRAERLRLGKDIEQHGWDGAWYLRAYFDDGTPLGSAANDECRIDSISQSWSVLSGVGDRSRSRLAMAAVDAQLVRRKDGLMQLLDPPFDKSAMNPGYIRGYVPGVRENGGQYTHAAIWASMAFAALGEGGQAWDLLALINPVNHALSPAAIDIYKVEPYVVAADVYAVAPHTGRGGWSWYTGSAGWMYRLVLESLLGLRLAGETLHIEPCLPAGWPGCKIRYRHRRTTYHIAVSPAPTSGNDRSGRVTIAVDGVECGDNGIALVDDNREHRVAVILHGK